MYNELIRCLYAIKEDRDNGMEDNQFEFFIGKLCMEYGTETVAKAMMEIGVD